MSARLLCGVINKYVFCWRRYLACLEDGATPLITAVYETTSSNFPLGHFEAAMKPPPLLFPDLFLLFLPKKCIQNGLVISQPIARSIDFLNCIGFLFDLVITPALNT